MDAVAHEAAAPAERGGHFYSLGPFDVPGLPPRRVHVYLPSGAVPLAARPCLYLFDGQNVFGDEGSFAGGWHAHRAVERLRRYPEVVAPVVVGVEHGGSCRLDELSAWPVRGGQGGRADAFLDWLVGTLLPRVQRTFGLRPGPLHQVVGGSSMGGLAALWAHWRHPDVFGGALCLSPSFFAGGGALFGEVQTRPRPPFSRVYIDCGAQEGGGRMAPLAQAMVRTLAGKGYGPGQLRWRLDRRGGHDEHSWRRRLPGALRFMFRRGEGGTEEGS